MKEHFIYVIGREQGPVKVGISSSPRTRLAELQTGCPFKISILNEQRMRDRDHALKHEKTFHEVYRKYRLMGEWFKIDADIAIDGICTGLELEQHFESLPRHG